MYKCVLRKVYIYTLYGPWSLHSRPTSTAPALLVISVAATVY